MTGIKETFETIVKSIAQTNPDRLDEIKFMMEKLLYVGGLVDKWNASDYDEEYEIIEGNIATLIIEFFNRG